MTNEDFAKKIKDIRDRQNMTIEELSERSGVKLEVLQAMEDRLKTHCTSQEGKT